MSVAASLDWHTSLSQTWLQNSILLQDASWIATQLRSTGGVLSRCRNALFSHSGVWDLRM